MAQVIDAQRRAHLVARLALIWLWNQFHNQRIFVCAIQSQPCKILPQLGALACSTGAASGWCIPLTTVATKRTT